MTAADPPSPTRRPEDIDAYERLATVARALANPLRLLILEILAQAPRRVDDLARTCGIPVKTVSHHLQRLRNAGLVTRTARGREGIYALADEEVAVLWTHLELFARQRYAQGSHSQGASSPSGPSAVRDLEREGRVTLLDVRPPEEYAAGHIRGAVSMPLAELERRIDELPRDRLVVAVCRGRYCRLADAAVHVLQERGFEAVRYSEGILEWRGEGRELVQGGAEDHGAPRPRND